MRITVSYRISDRYEDIIRVASIEQYIATLTKMIHVQPGKSAGSIVRITVIREMLGYVEDEREEKHAPIDPLPVPQYVTDAAARSRPVTKAAAACGKLLIYALQPLHAVARVIFEHFREECLAGDIYISVKGGVGGGIALMHELLRRGLLTRAKLMRIHAVFFSSDLDAAVMIQPRLPRRVFEELHYGLFGRTHKVMFDFRRDRVCIGGSLGDTIMADIGPHFARRRFTPLIAKERKYHRTTGRGFRHAETLPPSHIAYTLSRKVEFTTSSGLASFLLMRLVFPAMTPAGAGRGEFFDLAIARYHDSFLHDDFGRMYQGISGARIFAITDLIDEVLEER